MSVTLIDGLTPAEFLQKARATMKRGRPNKEMQEKLDRARALVDEQREERISKLTNPDEVLRIVERNFELLRLIGLRIASGKFNSLIASGAPGIGKTHTLDVEVFGAAAAKGSIHYTKVAGGSLTPVQCAGLLYEYRTAESVILIDDTDAVFEDRQTLNLLKAALDTSAVRRIQWLSSTDELDEDAKDFMFEGHVAFITNQDLKVEAAKDNQKAKDIRALLDRSHYLDLGLHNRQAQALWTARVVREKNLLVTAKKITPKQQEAVLKYLLAHYDRISSVSIRQALKLADYVELVKDVENADNWREIADAMI